MIFIMYGIAQTMLSIVIKVQITGYYSHVQWE